MIKQFLLFVCFSIYATILVGQQRNLTQFYNAAIYTNPAEAASDHSLRFSANYRKQWPSIGTGYQTKVFAVDLTHGSLGYGLVFASNDAGEMSLRTNQFLFNVSNQLKLNRISSLSYGMQFGLMQYNLNTSQYKFENQYSIENGYNPNASNGENFKGNVSNDFTGGFGLIWRNKKYAWKPKVSLAINNLIHARKTIFVASESNQRTLINTSVSFDKKLSRRTSLHPYLFYAIQKNAANFLVGSSLQYALDSLKNVQFGLGARNKDAFIAYMGIQILNVQLGFSYDINFSKLVPGTSGVGAYELSAIVRLNDHLKHKSIPATTVYRTDTVRIMVPTPESSKPKTPENDLFSDQNSNEPIDIHLIDNYWKYKQYRVYFDSDKSNILPKYQSILDELVEDLKQHPDHKLLLHGHTDSDGEALYNIYLGEARANEVMHYLINKGISHSKIKTFTYGKSNPVESNTSLEKKAKNRRVEIILLTK